MTTHELARELLKCPDIEVQASIDISSGDNDFDRRIFTNACMGVNDYNPHNNEITILFSAIPKDNYDNKL